jgi:hypothetical protein
MQRIDEDQMVNNAWTPSFCGYDGFGTVRQLTSFTGAVRDKYTVDAYGNAYDITGTTPNNYLYRGEQWDPGSQPVLPPRPSVQPQNGQVPEQRSGGRGYHKPEDAPQILIRRW